MIQNVIKKLFGTKHDREMKKLQPRVEQVGIWEKRLKDLSPEELAAKTVEFKQRYEKGESLDRMLPEAFAVARLAGVHALGMRHYNVQLIGGMVMHRGSIAEMRTGEGKTLTATLALYLNAISGKGAHLVTVNDYLATRDAEWMGKLYNFLGLSVGVTRPLHSSSEADKRAAYACDITYGTNNEYGFDYLRDNMKFDLDRRVQRGLNFAIVDEVDSILIDEARTPLIISGQAELNADIYKQLNEVVIDLNRDEDYVVDEEHRSVTLTDDGVEKIEERLGLENLFDPANTKWVHHVNKALEAHTLYKRDEKYMVRDGQIIIIDDFTGRAMPGRRWSEGLHQSIEAKEGVEIKAESMTLATITYQNFFRMYDKLSGMTGTADTEAEEFKDIYDMDTVVIPTNRPIQRLDQPDVVYRTEREKFTAIIDQIEHCHAKGQPVLVGTVSVDKSEVIAKILKKKGIEHSVLNAKQHGKEAGVVAQAGRKGAVTIATNMAGRGTDIVLGGNPEGMADRVNEDRTSEEWKRAKEKFEEICKVEKQEVLDAGGLFILGTERHDSRRIDNQLRGRAGRQGDPGESRFFLSLEDDLMKRFGADRIQGLMQALGMEEGVPIEAKMVSNSIEGAQKRVEGRNFDIRKHLLEYDDVMDVQRKTIYELRDKILNSEGLEELVLDLFDGALGTILDQYANPAVRVDEWDFEALARDVKDVFGLEIDPDSLPRGRGGIEHKLWPQVEAIVTGKIEELGPVVDAENASRKEAYEKAKAQLTERIAADQAALDGAPEEVPADLPEGEKAPDTRADIEARIARFEKQLDELEDPKVVSKEERFYEIARKQYMTVLDRMWREHLTAMRDLRDSVRLQGYAQKDPKHVYKKEGYDMFAGLQAMVNAEVSRDLSRMVVPSVEALRRAATLEAEKRQSGGLQVGAGAAAAAARAGIGAGRGAGAAAASSAAASPARATRRALPKIGRNDACWCGSGKKYKQCHMKSDRENGRPGASAPAASAAATPAPAPASTTDGGDEKKKTDGISII